MFNNIVVEVLALTGFAALVSLLINVGKVAGVVKEGTAGKWSAGLNLVGILALYIYRLVVPGAPVEGIDKTLLEIASVGSYILAFISEIGISKLTHFVVKGIPVIGKSFTLDRLAASKTPMPK